MGEKLLKEVRQSKGICITPNSISSWEAAVLELLVTFLGTELVGEFLLSHCLQFLQIMEAGGSYQFQNSQTCCVCLLSESSPSMRECFNSVYSLCFTSYGFDYDINILNIFCRILTPTNSNAMNLVRQHLRPMTEILFFCNPLACLMLLPTLLEKVLICFFLLLSNYESLCEPFQIGIYCWEETEPMLLYHGHVFGS